MMDLSLFFDIGGSNFRYRVGEGKVHRSKTYRWEEKMIDVIASYPGIKRVGIAFAGQVFNGEIRSAPNIAVERLNIKAFLEQRFPDLQVRIENDLKCAALAYRQRFKCDMIGVLYAGTGLGSASVNEGKIVRGCENMAGEIGHVSYQAIPLVCGCGKSDCLELFASGSGLEKQRHLLGLSDLSVDGWFAGNVQEQRTAETAADALAYAASLMITFYNPSVLVIGGGVWEDNPVLREKVKPLIAAKAFPPAFKGCMIVDADLENAPLIGAKLLFE
jgi:glucokinase